MSEPGPDTAGSPREPALERIAGIVGGAADADDALHAVVAVLADEADVAWAGIAFAEGDGLVLGPEAGAPDPRRRRSVPVRYGDVRVAELRVDGALDGAALEAVAGLIAEHCLVGWDTGGEPWNPA